MMPRKFLLLLIPVAAIIVFGFSNCSPTYTSSNQSADLSSLTCTVQSRNKIDIEFSQSTCEDISNFECEQRIFKPGIEQIRSEEIECFSIGLPSDVCVLVKTNSFDTEVARAGADAREFEDGGEFNREEVQCWNTKVQKRSIALIQADAKTLSDALSSAIEQCRARGTL